jgi:DNA polymerase III subunit delta
MLIFLYGQDTFRSRQHLKKMITKFRVDRDPQGLNVVKIDSEKEKESGKIMEQILAAPFLAEKRLVVVEGLLVSKHKDLAEDIASRIKEKSLPESNVIIFYEGTDKFKNKVAKSLAGSLSKEKFSQHFERLKGIKLSSWITSQVGERHGSISADAVRYLTDHSAGDTWRLNSLIDQLVAYRAKEEITVVDVQLFLDEKIDDNIFNLVDALCAGQSKMVYKMIQEQYRIGEDVQYMFAMILRQFRILLEMRDVHDREDITQSSALAQKLGLHPFVAKKSLPLVKRYKMSELKKIYNELQNLDVGIKTGKENQEVLLDLFVGKVCLQA